MKKAISILLYLWQLPQNLLGLILAAIYWPESSHGFSGERVFIASRMKGGISLGRYIIVSNDYYLDPTSVLHEYGHALQSRYLGPLYLLIIGLPSLLWAWWWKASRGVSFYWFYTEKWADKLGGVDRC